MKRAACTTRTKTRQDESDDTARLDGRCGVTLDLADRLLDGCITHLAAIGMHEHALNSRAERAPSTKRTDFIRSQIAARPCDGHNRHSRFSATSILAKRESASRV